MAPRLNTTRARQGRSGKPILWVLGISTTLAVLVLFGAWALKSGDLASTQPSPATKQAAAESFDTAEPTPRQNTEAPPPAR
jgi:hypothetical protein